MQQETDQLDGLEINADEQDNDSNEKDKVASFYKEHCIYLLPMLGWFFFSGCLSLYNKWVFGKAYYAFPCPLFMTSMHFGLQWIFSYTLTSIYPESLGGHQVSSMSWGVFLCISIPCGLVTAVDVGLSNLALVRISMTFYTMVKSSSPIFVVISAYLFGIEKITVALIMTVFIISGGELLTVMGEVEFDKIGFILVLFASIMSGMRWTVVQLKLQSHDPPIKSTIATMRILSPFMYASMVFLSIIFEKPWEKLLGEEIHYFDTMHNTITTLGLGLFGGSLAICMIICEFYLIMKSSAVILMIGGVIKELVTIIIGVSVMHDELNRINALGCFVVFSGVALYKVSLLKAKGEKTYDSVDMNSLSSNTSFIGGDYIHAVEVEDDAPLGSVIMREFEYDDDDDDDGGNLNDASAKSIDSSGTMSKMRRSKPDDTRPLADREDAEII